MKLALKFNLMFVVVFGLGLAATGYIANRFLQENARDEVVQQARLMMETSASTRDYTSNDIRPLLERYQRRSDTFYPQSVPAFSAIKVFSYLHKTYKDYAYREATLNPTNPEDRAVDWEADIIRTFRDDASKIDLVGQRETPMGPSLFLAAPMRSKKSCLECHSTPEAAPAAMVKLYGRNNGFGWKPDEIVAARIVSVPMAVPEARARKALIKLMSSLAGVTVLSLVLLNITLVLTVIRPVSRLSKAADEISQGNLDGPELPVKGKDEISVLADAFNRMHRSLKSAMKMIDG